MSFPEGFWEWMDEGTTEERAEKYRKLLTVVRQHRDRFIVSDEDLEALEAKLRNYDLADRKEKQVKLELASLKQSAAEAARRIDEALINGNIPAYPFSAKRKKDSH